MRNKGSKLILTILALLTVGVVAFASVETMPFRPFYWIVGQVLDSADNAAKADGHLVVFYKDEDSYNSNNSQATIDQNRFMMNGFFIYPLDLTVGGTYKVTICRGSDGYGLNPVDVTISGKGYDEVFGPGGIPLQIKPGEGLNPPTGGGEKIPTEPEPKIKLWFGNRLYQKALVEKGKKFIVSSKPDIKIDVSIDDNYAISKNIGDYSLTVDPGTAAEKGLALNASNISAKVMAQGTAAGEEKIQAFSISYAMTEPLADGVHNFQVSAKSAGTVGLQSIKMESATVEVMGGPLRLIGQPITYPSPYSISKNKTVYIQYELSADANIDIYLVGVTGVRVKKFLCNSGQEGGSAGVNKVSWDGLTDQGTLAGNAIYVGTIISRSDNRLLGKVKLTILD
ncbi:hypothetical protein A2311_00355 [candidate division WOR-1 bacterium RIFOXYB2_FULL_48_7]|uniref:FlgD Ig-like domain-containing protein n=1 Tax=candidate division WOR-1 bacterium RIFOXYB2_FULL_48_7 TaxID=1802583 RepID=A0A1F4TRC3_UNCSA|nr:MAG: hypothetical protein A2311_00355 [candidate division WOR-1 bacterium RIFOXYB2_FULL_48_7]